MEDRRAKRGLRSRNAERSEDEKGSRAAAIPASGGGGIFKSAAVSVLRQHRKLMTTGDITRLAVEMGLLKCQGKTPEATMASALYTDVKRKLQKSLFTRPQEGLFGLREWLDEGYYPEGWVGPPDGLGLAPFKRRNNAIAHQGGGSSGSLTPPAKAGRQGVRTGPGRSSKSRAARSWRNAASDAEDDDTLDEDDEPLLTGRSMPGSAARSAAAFAAMGDDDDVDDARGEGEEADVEEDPDDLDDTIMEEGQDERRHGADDSGNGAAALDDPQALSGRDGGGTRGQHQQPALSPGLNGARRSFRGRSGGGGSEGGVPQDECLSPLHMLGEAAASESVGDMAAEQHGTPPSKRKRPTSITVPDRGGGLGGAEAATPKSPYEDSLAALHEIATSPSTFELTSQREQHRGDRDGISGAGGRGSSYADGGSGKVGRPRPRLQVDVPAQGADLGGGPGSRRDGGTPGTTLLTDNLMLQGETTPAILLQASPVTTANGQQAMMLRQAPVLVTLPPALSSPSASAGGQLDTPALLHVQLPGGAPSELMQTTLITPTGQQLTPFRSHQGGRGGLKLDAGPASSRLPGRRVSFSGQVGILGPPSGAGGQLHQPLQPPGHVPSGATAGGPGHGGGASGGHVWPPKMTPAQVESELAEITRVQTVVERLESKLGNTHPQVGKAWLALSRMYQHVGEVERNNGDNCMSSLAKGAEALRRAWAVCRACAESCGTSVQCEEAFRYLTARTSEAALNSEAGAEAYKATDGDRAADQREGWAAAAATAEAAGQTPVGLDLSLAAAGGNAGSPNGGAQCQQQQRHELSLPGAGLEGVQGGEESGKRQSAVAVQG